MADDDTTSPDTQALAENTSEYSPGVGSHTLVSDTPHTIVPATTMNQGVSDLAAVAKYKNPSQTLRPGMTSWRKGQSGNPSGLKANPLKQFFREDAIACRNLLVDYVKNPKMKPNIRLKAAEILLERHMGKPRQEVEVAGDIHHRAIDLTRLTTDHLDALQAILIDTKIIDVEPDPIALLPSKTPDKVE